MDLEFGGNVVKTIRPLSRTGHPTGSGCHQVVLTAQEHSGLVVTLHAEDEGSSLKSVKHVTARLVKYQEGRDMVISGRDSPPDDRIY